MIKWYIFKISEYSLETGVVLRRMWKKKKELRVNEEWETELGEILTKFTDNQFTVRESCTEPMLTKRITKTNIEFRIRNLPYPIEVYSVSANSENNSITVRTTNKKYYKNIKVEELERCGLKPTQANISISHQFNTLIIKVSINTLVTFTWFLILCFCNKFLKTFCSTRNLNQFWTWRLEFYSNWKTLRQYQIWTLIVMIYLNNFSITNLISNSQ